MDFQRFKLFNDMNSVLQMFFSFLKTSNIKIMKLHWKEACGEVELQRENSVLAAAHMNMKLNYSGISLANIFPFW